MVKTGSDFLKIWEHPTKKIMRITFIGMIIVQALWPAKPQDLKTRK
jgi:hypothetical protein